MYHPFYCEENMFYLAREARFAGRRPSVVFVSSASGAVAMGRQRASPRRDGLLVWDYHVVLLVEGPWEIWDLDTTLGAPLPARDYLVASFPRGLPDAYAPLFRLVEASELAASFSSDRSHMRRKDGSYRRPPPPWSPIVRPGEPSNLKRFVDMQTTFLGEVLDLPSLLRRVELPLSPGDVP